MENLMEYPVDVIEEFTKMFCVNGITARCRSGFIFFFLSP